MFQVFTHETTASIVLNFVWFCVCKSEYLHKSRYLDSLRGEERGKTEIEYCKGWSLQNPRYIVCFFVNLHCLMDVVSRETEPNIPTKHPRSLFGSRCLVAKAPWENMLHLNHVLQTQGMTVSTSSAPNWIEGISTTPYLPNPWGNNVSPPKNGLSFCHSFQTQCLVNSKTWDLWKNHENMKW